MIFVPLDDLLPDQRRRAREAYERSFPAGLRQEFEELGRDDEALAYLDEEHTVLGLVVLRAMREPGWAYLRYFLAAERGRGAGSRMWRALFADRPALQRLVLDVEDPHEPDLPAEELDERRRRVVFYERLGASVLPVEGYAPPHESGAAEPLRLLVGDRVPGTLEPSEVRQVLIAAYRDRYGLSEADPAVGSTLHASGL